MLGGWIFSAKSCEAKLFLKTCVMLTLLLWAGSSNNLGEHVKVKGVTDRINQRVFGIRNLFDKFSHIFLWLPSSELCR